MTGSRIMMFGSYLDGDQLHNWKVWKVAVWNWETGDLVRLLRLDEL